MAQTKNYTLNETQSDILPPSYSSVDIANWHTGESGFALYQPPTFCHGTIAKIASLKLKRRFTCTHKVDNLHVVILLYTCHITYIKTQKER